MIPRAQAPLVGVAIYDRLPSPPPDDPHLLHLTWRRRELENYLCRRGVLLDFAEAEGRRLRAEIAEKLDAIAGAANRARPRER